MLTDKYIIISSKSPVVPTIDNLGTRAFVRAFENEPETLEVEEAVLTRSERSDLRRDPRTRAIAPPMPLKLIDPIDSQAVSPAEAEDVTWGVRAVGALESPFDGTGITAAVLDDSRTVPFGSRIT